MKASEMTYSDMLDFLKDMNSQGYIADTIHCEDWKNSGVGFTNEDKNIFVLCYFDSESMTVYPYIPTARKEEVDCYLDLFIKAKVEINNAHLHLEKETKRLKEKYKDVFNVKMI